MRRFAAQVSLSGSFAGKRFDLGRLGVDIDRRAD
jgi:hypothetical protein